MLIVGLAIFAAVFATTLGVVWHSHEHTSEANCAICHLNHQHVNNSLSIDPAALHFVGTRPDPPEPGLVQSPLIVRVPARAPPTA
jgi:hypothetical protein